MHGNRRYVKLTWIALPVGLALASPARAEVVTRRADRGVLAVAPDGSPRVAYPEPRTGIPFGFLPGVPDGVSG